MRSSVAKGVGNILFCLLSFIAVAQCQIEHVGRWPISNSSQPMADTITSAYGLRNDGTGVDYHSGIDIRTPNGTATLIRASVAGRIETIQYNDPALGHRVRIVHQGKFSLDYLTSYAHLSSIEPGLLVKDTIQAGDVIGHAGRTGSATAVHLHFHVQEEGLVQGMWPLKHPMRLLPYNNLNPPELYWVTTIPSATGGIERVNFRVHVDSSELDFSFLEVFLYTTELQRAFFVDFEDYGVTYDSDARYIGDVANPQVKTYYAGDGVFETTVTPLVYDYQPTDAYIEYDWELAFTNTDVFRNSDYIGIKCYDIAGTCAIEKKLYRDSLLVGSARDARFASLDALRSDPTCDPYFKPWEWGNVTGQSPAIAVHLFDVTLLEGRPQVVLMGNETNQYIGANIHRCSDTASGEYDFSSALIPLSGESVVVVDSTYDGEPCWYTYSLLSRSGETYQSGDFIPVVGSLPESIALWQNYPNPFNPTTTIVVDIPTSHSGRIELSVYNMNGQLVKTIASGHVLPGIHEYAWDGRDAGGQAVASGTYLYRLRTSESDITRKMMLLK